jgi:hypothetical protein
MGEWIQQKLKQLQEDYSNETGGAFENFYCPVTFKDEPVQLCVAHIITNGAS